MEEHRLTLDTLDRLATQFRADVHSALSAAIRIGDQSAGINVPAQSNDTEHPAAANSSDAADSSASLQTENDSSRQLFTLTLPNGKEVDYQVSGGSVNRTLREGEHPLATESYMLPTQAVVKWEITSSDFNRGQSGWQASLLISYPRSNLSPELSDRRQLRVDAAAGLQISEIRLSENKP
jgi:hypothetical protein